jgi:hypothetical protein
MDLRTSGERYSPLLKPLKRVILASNRPRIWRMSVITSSELPLRWDNALKRSDPAE